MLGRKGSGGEGGDSFVFLGWLGRALMGGAAQGGAGGGAGAGSSLGAPDGHAVAVARLALRAPAAALLAAAAGIGLHQADVDHTHAEVAAALLNCPEAHAVAGVQAGGGVCWDALPVDPGACLGGQVGDVVVTQLCRQDEQGGGK